MFLREMYDIKPYKGGKVMDKNPLIRKMLLPVLFIREE